MNLINYTLTVFMGFFAIAKTVEKFIIKSKLLIINYTTVLKHDAFLSIA